MPLLHSQWKWIQYQQVEALVVGFNKSAIQFGIWWIFAFVLPQHVLLNKCWMRHSQHKCLSFSGVGSHNVALHAAVLLTQGSILELGCGFYSTPFLNKISRNCKRMVLACSWFNPPNHTETNSILLQMYPFGFPFFERCYLLTVIICGWTGSQHFKLGCTHFIMWTAKEIMVGNILATSIV